MPLPDRPTTPESDNPYAKCWRCGKSFQVHEVYDWEPVRQEDYLCSECKDQQAWLSHTDVGEDDDH